MRKQAGSWMIKVILFAIVVVFVFWGVGSFRSEKESMVATVNDKIIDISQYRTTYNNLIEQYRRQFGSSLNDGMIEMLNVKKQAVDQLINRELILQEAEKLNLVVSQQELVESIQSIPAFQVGGTFDTNRYHQVLARVHLTPETFEASQSQSLLVGKMQDLISGTAKVSDEEIKQWYDFNNTTVNIAYALFAPDRYKKILPADDKIEDHFNADKEAYKTEPSVKARYIVFEPTDYTGEVIIEEGEIADYYDAHLSEFKTEKSVHARHILIKAEEDADETADETARKKAEEVMKKAVEGEDFAELAKNFSEGPSNSRGGDLGTFTKNQMVKPFADKAFSMKAGEVSEPVRTRFGWHVIKLEKINEAYTKTLEEAAESIRKSLIEMTSKNIAYDKAEAFYEATFDGDDFLKNAQANKMTPLETDLFTRTGPQQFGTDKGAFASAAFELDVMDISDVKELGNKFYIIQVMEKVDSKIPEFAAVKDKVKADLVKKMQDEKAEEDAGKLLAMVKEGKTMADAAKAFDVASDETGAFKRSGTIPKIGFDGKVLESSFLLTGEKDLPDAPVPGTKGFYVIQLKERKVPDAAGLEDEKDNIKNQLLQQKKFQTFSDWVEQLKSESTIEIKEAFQN